MYLQFTNDIAVSKDWSIEKTKDIINNGPYWITQDAIDKELVDGAKYPDEFKKYIKTLTEEYEIIRFKEINTKEDYVYDWKQKKQRFVLHSLFY